MSTGTYVTRRSGTANFSARIIVPPDLRDAIGKAEIWKSLGTADKREATKRSAAVFAKFLAEFDAARRTRPATDADLQQAAYDYYVVELERDAADRGWLAGDRASNRLGRDRIAAELASGVPANMGYILDLELDLVPNPDRFWLTDYVIKAGDAYSCTAQLRRQAEGSWEECGALKMRAAGRRRRLRRRRRSSSRRRRPRRHEAHGL